MKTIDNPQTKYVIETKSHEIVWHEESEFPKY